MSVEERLAALRVSYGAALPAKLAELGRALEEPMSGEAARALAHRLRGTAATYGFSAVSEACAAIEARLEAGDHDGAMAAFAALTRGEAGSPSTARRTDP